MRRWLVLGCLLSVINACGDDERRPLVSPRLERGGSGGSSTGGDDGMGGEPTSGSGGTSGVAGTGGLLDPNEIYVSGTIDEGNSNAYAFAKVSEPNIALLGFPGNYGAMTAKMLDGELVYQTMLPLKIRRFVRDSQTSAPYSPDTYPRMPDANDPELSTEPCSDSDNILSTFLTGPDGRFVYQCTLGWYEDGERLDIGDLTPFAIGHDDLVLVPGVGIVDGADGTVITDEGVPIPITLIAARAFEDGFYMVDTAWRLWELSVDGSATELGSYPAAEADMSVLAQTSTLGPDNALYEIGSDLSGEIILRRTIDGDSEVIYSEADNPLVKVAPFTSMLVSGR